MKTLTINAGSSSIKLSVFKEDKEIKSINYEFIPGKISQFKIHLKDALKKLNIKPESISLCAHRVVHGGYKYSKATLITDQVKKDVKKLSELAPLHNPLNLEAIKFFQKKFKCPHFAVFDTALFHNLPEVAKIYPIPIKYYHEDDIQKYGFHGTSHKYLFNQISSKLKLPNATGITCHLGNGVSLTLFYEGEPLETTMGFTPLAGCPMGTRSGDIDPGIIIYLKKKYKTLNIEQLLNKESGLKGLTNTHHMKEVHDLALNGHKSALLAIEIYCYKIAKQISSLYGLVPELDFLVFSGGIGLNAPYIRQTILEYLPGLILPDPVIIESKESLQIYKESLQEYLQ